MKKAKVAAVEEREHLIFGQQGSLLKRYQRRGLYNQLRAGYEVSVAFKLAREEALAGLRHFEAHASEIDGIRRSLEKDIRDVRSSLLDLVRLYPEVASSITTSVGARTVLNRQRRTLEELHGEGLLDATEFDRLRHNIDAHLKRLLSSPPIILVPKKEDILRQLPWLQCLRGGEMRQITHAFEENVFKTNDILVQQGASDDRVHILARGTVRVVYDKPSGERVEVDEIGIGSVFGEISYLLARRRGASIVASSSGLVFTIDGHALRHFIAINPQLEDSLWKTCGRRLAENLLAAKLEARLSRRQVRDLVCDMTITNIHRNGLTSAWFQPSLDRHIVLLSGRASYTGEGTGRTEIIDGPAVLDPKPAFLTEDGSFEVEFSEGSKFMCHPETRTVVRRRSNGVGEAKSVNHTGSPGPISPSSCRELVLYEADVNEGEKIDGDDDIAHHDVDARGRRSSLLEMEFKTSSAYSATLSVSTNAKGGGASNEDHRSRPRDAPKGVDRNANIEKHEIIAQLRSPESSRSASEADSSMSDPTGMV